MGGHAPGIWLLYWKTYPVHQQALAIFSVHWGWHTLETSPLRPLLPIHDHRVWPLQRTHNLNHSEILPPVSLSPSSTLSSSHSPLNFKCIKKLQNRYSPRYLRFCSVSSVISLPQLNSYKNSLQVWTFLTSAGPN